MRTETLFVWRSSGSRLLARYAIVALCILPGSSNAQAAFTSRDAYLLAERTTVRRTLGAIDISDATDLDRLARANVQQLVAFFVVAPAVTWADGQGSSSHPSAGIALDRIRLREMRNRLGALEFDDVLLFVLAHEFAHSRQFQIYSLASLRDATKLRAVECEADLWAGAAMINLLSAASLQRLGQTRPRADEIERIIARDMTRIRSAAALAYQIGTPSWEDIASHPRPSQRILCVSRGVNGGMHMQLVDRYMRTQRPELLAEINQWRLKDPRLFGPGADLWAWANGEAKAIVNFEGASWDPPGGRPNLLAAIDRLLDAAVSGATELRSQSQFPLPGSSCKYEEFGYEAYVICRYGGFFSEQILHDQYVGFREMLRGRVSARGWVQGREQASDVLTYIDFAPPSQSLPLARASFSPQIGTDSAVVRVTFVTRRNP